jgi:hypothetical protein
MTVHNATFEMDGETYIFSSLDGENWLPVNRKGTEADAEALATLFEGDGNMRPMRFTRMFLISRGASFDFGDFSIRLVEDEEEEET